MNQPGTGSAPKRFSLFLIKPSHYDDDGYVIQWFRSAIPSNTLAALYGLALDCQARKVLGDDVQIEITALDEMNTRVRPERISKQINGYGLVALIGVQSNQYPRAMDLARRFRELGVQVSIGGFHVSGSLAMLPGMPPELQEAMDLGVSLFAGEAEGRFEQLLQDAGQGALKLLYNYMSDLPGLQGAPIPILPARRVKRTGGRLTSFDAGRGCPFQCSFCTIINVQGRKSRWRTADDVEHIVRENLKQGINRFFITDDNFARNRDWENIFDRLIELREQQKLNIKFVIQVDTMCHRIPRFIEKARRAGVVRVFIGMENINPDSLMGSKKKQNKIAEYRKMLLQWKHAGVLIIAGYILGFPSDTPASIRRDIRIIQRELPVDLIEFNCLTPLPGSEDHQRLFNRSAYLESDLNKYDLEHATMTHPAMSKQEWEQIFWEAWTEYFSPEHMETLLRRATALKINPGNMLFLMLWFHACVTLEHVHPLQGGYFRRKYRHDRRPKMPVESIWGFYPRFAFGVVYKHIKMAASYWRYGRLRYKLRGDPEALKYTDTALTPVTEEDVESLELFTVVGQRS